MTTITPRKIDIAGFPVRRSLPTRVLRSIGPWVFFDHMGPHTYSPGKGVDVIPHPHINLATVTYLFRGEIVHRDTLGSVQPIRPGAINLMVAGRGIAHSERTSDDLRRTGHEVHGLQLWHALPAEIEERESSFLHYASDTLPAHDQNGFSVRVLMGEAFGERSPVLTYVPTLYVELTSGGKAEIKLPDSCDELALYVVESSGTVTLDDTPIEEAHLVADVSGRLASDGPCRVVLIGGSSVGKRYMWWNFVSSRIERIEQAKDDWRSGHFGHVINDTEEWAPLPETDSHAHMKE